MNLAWCTCRCSGHGSQHVTAPVLNPSLVAAAFCRIADCAWRTYVAESIHERAQDHWRRTGHGVVVSETVTTTYEATP